MAPTKGTYVYCVIAAARRPRVPAKARTLPGLGSVRLLDVEPGLYVAVADAPLSRYGEAQINRGLGDLEWVSRAAVAHEAVIESFVGETAVLPMKLFTIFTSDARVLEHIASQRTRIASLVKRVANHQEWGVRLMLDRARAGRAAAGGANRTRSTASRSSRAVGPGASFLQQKRAQRDATVELASRARSTVAKLYDRLEAKSRLAKRRPASELPPQGGPLLLDAAFLVPRARAASFKALTAREARTLSRQGYGMTVSGPWPPYTFVQD
jgi:Gas vesicle synthesis protein GvpL/GvpF